MKCPICETRKPRRYCPGMRAEICSICCGEQREVTIDCPLDCPHLMEGRLHEKQPTLNPDTFPNQDVQLTDRFLREHEGVLFFGGMAVLHAALKTPGAIDFDVREALESLIRTYRTLESGLYFESLPQNPIAAAVHQSVQEQVATVRKKMAEKGESSFRDVEFLAILVLLQRLELQHNNGRKRGRAFIDFLRSQFPHGDEEEEKLSGSLIQTV